jgi:hypothetical protein
VDYQAELWPDFVATGGEGHGEVILSMVDEDPSMCTDVFGYEWLASTASTSQVCFVRCSSLEREATDNVYDCDTSTTSSIISVLSYVHVLLYCICLQ